MFEYVPSVRDLSVRIESILNLAMIRYQCEYDKVSDHEAKRLYLEDIEECKSAIVALPLLIYKGQGKFSGNIARHGVRDLLMELSIDAEPHQEGVILELIEEIESVDCFVGV